VSQPYSHIMLQRDCLMSTNFGAYSEQLDSASALMDEIHKSVLELQQNRQHVKETLVVMDKHHPRFQDADFTITYNPVQMEQTSTLPNPSEPFRPLNHQLLDQLASKTWKPRCIRCTSDWENIPLLLNSDLKLVLRDDKIACLEISLSDDVKTNLDEAYQKHISQKRKLSEAKVPAPVFLDKPIRRQEVLNPSNSLSGALANGMLRSSYYSCYIGIRFVLTSKPL
jgi:hypothetical protein